VNAELYSVSDSRIQDCCFYIPVSGSRDCSPNNIDCIIPRKNQSNQQAASQAYPGHQQILTHEHAQDLRRTRSKSHPDADFRSPSREPVCQRSVEPDRDQQQGELY
jgi:hypothetical protein